ncbi:MAG: 2-dehydro-3-deoxy-6-phosphogalactonate aldolase [Neomegalonema sp.]|nr:2-dehydro-3-deoxy-6-phosphogalactonate aldolase [Neomegalonema sp.]
MSLSLAEALQSAPVLAVLRGVTPEQIQDIGAALVEAGVLALEVTLDSPEPYKSLEILAANFADRAAICAGTVLQPDQVGAAAAAGAATIVAPNFSPSVVAETVRRGLVSAPGVMTPSEAFAAIDAGASMLKLFPGDALPPAAVKGIRAVTPADIPLMVTGGVSHETIGAFLKAGAVGVGIGGALFKPGKSTEDIRADAQAFVAAAKAV